MSSRRVHFLLILLLTLCLSCVDALGYCEDSDFVQRYGALVEEGALPGAVVVIATPTEILTSESVGYADISTREPLSDSTLFWMASNTKAVVAAATMICVEEGLLDLDVPVTEYIPEFNALQVAYPQEDGSTLLKKSPRAPTLRQALSHTAGFRFITPLQERYGIDVLCAQRLMSLVSVTPLLSEPGTKYNYSNLGISVAQAAIEKVTQQKLEDFLEARIFKPLGMTETTFFPSEEQLQKAAVAYRWNDEKKELFPILVEQLPSLYDGAERHSEAGGGLFSTARDYVKFYQMLGGKGVGANGVRILSEESVAIMTSKQTGEGLTESYGFGLTVDDDKFGHGGAYGTAAMAYRDGSVVGVYLVAVSGVPMQGAGQKIFAEYLESFAKSRVAK
ncbi:MAG: serine hydrolase domain-containing protein [Planctomycetia bacterium]|nr:serine hydrolase domain-containing protein [Planctomycetia bacterium]